MDINEKIENISLTKKDISYGGEFYDWANRIEHAAKKIEDLTDKLCIFIKVIPFNKVRGPYAKVRINLVGNSINVDELWQVENTEDRFYLELSRMAGTPELLAQAIQLDPAAKNEAENNFKQLTEISTTGGVAGYMTPFAFTKKKRKIPVFMKNMGWSEPKNVSKGGYVRFAPGGYWDNYDHGDSYDGGIDGGLVEQKNEIPTNPDGTVSIPQEKIIKPYYQKLINHYLKGVKPGDLKPGTEAYNVYNIIMGVKPDDNKVTDLVTKPSELNIEIEKVKHYIRSNVNSKNNKLQFSLMIDELVNDCNKNNSYVIIDNKPYVVIKKSSLTDITYSVGGKTFPTLVFFNDEKENLAKSKDTYYHTLYNLSEHDKEIISKMVGLSDVQKLTDFMAMFNKLPEQILGYSNVIDETGKKNQITFDQIDLLKTKNLLDYTKKYNTMSLQDLGVNEIRGIIYKDWKTRLKDNYEIFASLLDKYIDKNGHRIKRDLTKPVPLNDYVYYYDENNKLCGGILYAFDQVSQTMLIEPKIESIVAINMQDAKADVYSVHELLNSHLPITVSMSKYFGYRKSYKLENIDNLKSKNGYYKNGNLINKVTPSIANDKVVKTPIIHNFVKKPTDKDTLPNDIKNIGPYKKDVVKPVIKKTTNKNKLNPKQVDTIKKRLKEYIKKYISENSLTNTNSVAKPGDKLKLGNDYGSVINIDSDGCINVYMMDNTIRHISKNEKYELLTKGDKY